MGIHYTQEDMAGKSPGYVNYAIGRTFKHNRRGTDYTVKGFCWIGDLDLWGVIHVGVEDGDLYVRTIANFFGDHLDGNKRFSEVPK